MTSFGAGWFRRGARGARSSSATATFAGIKTFSTGTLPLEVAAVPGSGLGDTANWSPAVQPPVATTAMRSAPEGIGE